MSSTSTVWLPNGKYVYDVNSVAIFMAHFPSKVCVEDAFSVTSPFDSIYDNARKYELMVSLCGYEHPSTGIKVCVINRLINIFAQQKPLCKLWYVPLLSSFRSMSYFAISNTEMAVNRDTLWSQLSKKNVIIIASGLWVKDFLW